MTCAGISYWKIMSRRCELCLYSQTPAVSLCFSPLLFLIISHLFFTFLPSVSFPCSCFGSLIGNTRRVPPGSSYRFSTQGDRCNTCSALWRCFVQACLKSSCQSGSFFSDLINFWAIMGDGKGRRAFLLRLTLHEEKGKGRKAWVIQTEWLFCVRL